MSDSQRAEDGPEGEQVFAPNLPESGEGDAEDPEGTPTRRLARRRMRRTGIGRRRRRRFPLMRQVRQLRRLRPTL
jgi:hypothetical protein